MEDLFYNDVWRMDWGLGDPNKTAALIAELMVAVWWMAYWRRWGFWVAVGVFAFLGICLVHTFSRGGLVALIFGLITIAVYAPRPWPLARCLGIGVTITVMVAMSFAIDAHERYGQGVISQDRSVSNRLMLWRAAPAMMVDAPGGWGIGNSGTAFVRWYQPIEHNEQYRTLVNSHLTWLVEFSWPLRFLYFFSWLVIFLLCLPTNSDRWRVIPLAIWITFGVASFFSSVAESIWLWLVPTFSLVVVVGHRLLAMHWPKLIIWTVPVAVASFLCVVIVLLGTGRTSIRKKEEQIIVGTGDPLVWAVVDERTLGKYGYARVIRNYLDEHPSQRLSVGIVESLTALPGDLGGKKVIVSGRPDEMSEDRIRRILSSASKVVLISPSYYPSEAGLEPGTIGDLEVIFGEFSQSRFVSAWIGVADVRRVPGLADYFPNWPELVLSRNRPLPVPTPD